MLLQSALILVSGGGHATVLNLDSRPCRDQSGRLSRLQMTVLDLSTRVKSVGVGATVRRWFELSK
jgi:hypothetical protein